MNNSKEYQFIINLQIYIILCIKFNLTYAISQISQFNNTLNETHHAVIKRILRYLKKTVHVSIMFSESLELELKLYCDTD